MQLWDQGQWDSCHFWNLVINRVSLRFAPCASLGITSVQERRLGVRATAGVGVRRSVLEPRARARAIHMQIRRLERNRWIAHT